MSSRPEWRDRAVVYRSGLPPKCIVALESLAGSIDDATMRQLNYEVEGRHRPLSEVVREFLSRTGRHATGSSRTPAAQDAR